MQLLMHMCMDPMAGNVWEPMSAAMDPGNSILLLKDPEIYIGKWILYAWIYVMGI